MLYYMSRRDLGPVSMEDLYLGNLEASRERLHAAGPSPSPQVGPPGSRS